MEELNQYCRGHIGSSWQDPKRKTLARVRSQPTRGILYFQEIRRMLGILCTDLLILTYCEVAKQSGSYWPILNAAI